MMVKKIGNQKRTKANIAVIRVYGTGEARGGVINTPTGRRGLKLPQNRDYQNSDGESCQY